MLALLLLLVPAGAAHAQAPLTLEGAYQRALTRSPEIQRFQQRIMEVEANVDRAWALIKPQISTSYTFTHLEPPPPEISFPNLQSPDVVDNCRQGGDPVACINALQASLDDPIVLDLSQGDSHVVSSRIVWSPLNGRAIPAIKNAYEAVDAEQDRTDAQRRQILLAVARAYYAAAATKRTITAAERTVERTKTQLELIKTRAALGEGADLAVAAAESAAKEAVLNFARAKNAHRQALLGLWLVTYSDDRPEVLEPPTPQLPKGDRAALLSTARTHRPELSAAEKAVTIADRAKDEIWWRMAPVIGVFGGHRYSNVQGLSGQNSQWSVGLTATLTLYDGGLRYADLASAEARLQSALLSRRSLEHQIEGEVDRALLGVEGADLGVERAKEGLFLAEKTLDVSQAQYEVGTIRLIELKEATDRALDAEIVLIRARMDRAVAILELRAAVGLFDPRP